MQITHHQEVVYSIHLTAAEFGDLLYALQAAAGECSLGHAQKILDYADSIGVGF